MLSACHLQQGYILLINNGVPTACGLGVIQNGYIGLFDIITASDQRRQGMAEQLLLALLHWGKTQGATTAFCRLYKLILELRLCTTSSDLRRYINIGIECSLE